MAFDAMVGKLRVEVTAGTSGLNATLENTRRALDSTDKRVRKSSGTWNEWSGALSAAAAVAGSLAVAGVIKLADSATSIENKMRLATKSMGEFNATTSQLFSLSNETRSSVSATVELYARMERATRELGLTSNEMLGITKSINQGFAIGGATAQEAAGSIRQFTQALSAGALRGDEFNSVAEQAPVIMEAIKKELGKTSGELKRMAEEGELTTDILIRSLKNYADTIDREFKETQRTFGQSMEVATNNAIDFARSNDTVQDAVQAAGDAIVFLSENLSVIMPLVTGLSIAFAVKLTAGIASSTFAMMANNAQQIMLQVNAMKTASASGVLAVASRGVGLAITTALGPIGLAIAALGALAIGFADANSEAEKAKDKAKDAREEFANMSDAAISEEIDKGIDSVVDYTFRLAELENQLAKVNEKIKSSSIGKSGIINTGLLKQARDLLSQINALKQEEIDLNIRLKAAGDEKDKRDLDGIAAKKAAEAQAIRDRRAAFEESFFEELKAEEKAIKEREKLREREKQKKLEDAASELESLRNSLKSESEIAEDEYRTRQEAINTLRMNGTLFGDALTQAEFDAFVAFEDEKTRIEEAESAKRRAIAQAEAQEKINTFKNVAGGILGLAAAFGSKSEKQQKRFRRAQVIVDTAAGVMNAFATSGNIYAAIGLAAMVVAQGKMALDSINSKKPMSGVSASVGSSFSGGGNTQQQNQPARNVNISVSGSGALNNWFLETLQQNVAPALNQALGNGHKVNFNGG